MYLSQSVLIIVVLSVVVFFVFREVWAWYFKINEIKSVLHDIRDLLVTINKKNDTTGQKS
jgi:CHASE3 domain sensor protein